MADQLAASFLPSYGHPVVQVRQQLIGLRGDEAECTHDVVGLGMLVLAEPIVIAGRLVAWATNTAHHADFVDRSHAHIAALSGDRAGNG